jgi:hypothetical protein
LEEDGSFASVFTARLNPCPSFDEFFHNCETVAFALTPSTSTEIAEEAVFPLKPKTA